MISYEEYILQWICNIEYQISNQFTKYVTLTVLHFLIGISSHTSSSTTRHFVFLGQSMIIFLKHFIWGTGLHLMEQIVRWYYSWCSMRYSNNRIQRFFLHYVFLQYLRKHWIKTYSAIRNLRQIKRSTNYISNLKRYFIVILW